MKPPIGLSCLLAIGFVAPSFHSTRQVLPALPEWITYRVDDHFSVQLPVPPVEKDWRKAFTQEGLAPSAEQLEKLNGTKVFRATDGVAVYTVGASSGIVTTRSTPRELARLYDGAIKGLLSKVQGGLLQRSAFTVNGFEGVEISYTAASKAPGKRVVTHQRMLIIAPWIYDLALYPVEKNDSMGQSVKEQRAKFFNSIVYTPSPELKK